MKSISIDALKDCGNDLFWKGRYENVTAAYGKALLASEFNHDHDHDHDYGRNRSNAIHTAAQPRTVLTKVDRDVQPQPQRQGSRGRKWQNFFQQRNATATRQSSL